MKVSRTKRTVLFLVVLASISVAAFEFGEQLTARQNQQCERADRARLDETAALMGEFIGARIEMLHEDISVLAGSTELMDVVGRSHAAATAGDASKQGAPASWRSELEYIFASFLNAKPDYASLSYVAAFESGLVGLRAPRQQEGMRSSGLVSLGNGEMRALWYADYVREVVRSGSAEPRVSQVVWESGSLGSDKIPVLRAVIALPSADDLTPGAVILSMDLRPLQQRVSKLAPIDMLVQLADGQAAALLEDEGDPDFDTALQDGAKVAPQDPVGDGLDDEMRGRVDIFAERRGRIQELLVGLPVSEQGRMSAERTAQGLLHVARIGETKAHGPRFVLLTWLPVVPAASLDIVMTPLGAVVGCLIYLATAICFSLALGGRSLNTGDTLFEEGQERKTLERVSGPVHRISREIQEVALSPVEFDVREVAGEVMDCVEASGASIVIKCQGDFPALVVGDPGWIGPLILWAGSAMSETVEGEPVEVSISGDSRGDRLQLRVQVTAAEETRPPDGAVIEPSLQAPAVMLLLAQMNGEVEVEPESSGSPALNLYVPLEVAAA